MKTPALKPREAATAAAMTAAVAAAAVFGLMSLTKPAHFDERLATVRGQADLARRLTSKHRAPTFPSGAICSLSPPVEAERLRAELQSAAAASKLDQVDIQVNPQRDADDGLAPLRVRLSASGPYESVLGVLQKLSAVRPVFFVDTVDLTSKTSFVALNLTGRVLCSVPR